MRGYIAGLLAEEYAVRTAPDGTVGLALARAEPPDLVLTDVMMPHMDGFELLAALAADPATMAVPVVMLSARAGDEAAVESLEAGADDYLVKPFTARELLARVRANLELDRSRRTQAELERSRALLDQAEALAGVGSWETDLTTGELRGSDEYYRLLGVEPGEIKDGAMATRSRFVHPGDIDRVSAALAAAAEHGEPLDVEFRVLPAGGAPPRVVRARAIRIADPNGAPAYLRGSFQDITEQRAAETAITEAAAAREAAEREQRIAEELQHAMLPAQLPALPGLEVAWRYAAGEEGIDIGGDWYDLIDLGDRRALFVVGDVSGRGLSAAVIMAALRYATRAYAAQGDLPETIVAKLSNLVKIERDGHFATVMCATIDIERRSVTVVNAGHLPPFLLTGKHLEIVQVPAGVPVGVATRPRYTPRTVQVEPDATLLAFTDGLIERRGESIDLGLKRFHDTAMEVFDLPLDQLVSTLVDRLSSAGDDTAILGVRWRV